VNAPVATAIAAATAAAVALAGLVSGCAIAFHDWLPRLTVDAVQMSGEKAVPVAMMLLSGAALLLLAHRRRSVLDLWLLVVLFAWLLDSMLTYATGARYTTVWYANRVVRVVAANVVLFAMLAETMHLYAKLASAAVAQRRERQSRMMTMEAMSAAIEHELRQPLAAIVANAGAAQRWLARTPPNATEAMEAVEQITAEGKRAAEILGSVRRLFASHDPPVPQPLDANAIIEDTVAHARVALDSSAAGADPESREQCRGCHARDARPRGDAVHSDHRTRCRANRDRGFRHGSRDRRARHGADLRGVLHDEGRRHGNGARPVPHHRRTARGHAFGVARNAPRLGFPRGLAVRMSLARVSSTR
jgi:signal transduction histidine kinase